MPSENFVIHEDHVAIYKEMTLHWSYQDQPNSLNLLNLPWNQSPFEDPLVVVGWGKTENFQELTSEGVYSLRYQM